MSKKTKRAIAVNRFTVGWQGSREGKGGKSGKGLIALNDGCDPRLWWRERKGNRNSKGATETVMGV